MRPFLFVFLLSLFFFLFFMSFIFYVFFVLAILLPTVGFFSHFFFVFFSSQALRFMIFVVICTILTPYSTLIMSLGALIYQSMTCLWLVLSLDSLICWSQGSYFLIHGVDCSVCCSLIDALGPLFCWSCVWISLFASLLSLFSWSWSSCRLFFVLMFFAGVHLYSFYWLLFLLLCYFATERLRLSYDYASRGLCPLKKPPSYRKWGPFGHLIYSVYLSCRRLNIRGMGPKGPIPL